VAPEGGTGNATSAARAQEETDEPHPQGRGRIMTKHRVYAYNQNDYWGQLGASTGCSIHNGSIKTEEWALGGCGEKQWKLAAQGWQNVIANQIQYVQTAATAQTVTTNWAGLGNYYLWNMGVGGWAQYPQVSETAEQKAERIRTMQIAAAKTMAASKRAEKLLFTILSPSQVKQYSDDGYFEQDIGGRIYRLHANSRSGNVVLLENGKPKFKYCAHPEDAHDTPIPDVLLSQLLMLKANEQDFLKIANRTVLR
jgi:hypothetical protein